MTKPLSELLEAAAACSLTGLRIGVPENHFFDDCGPGVTECVQRALAQLERKGALLVRCSLPEAAEAARWMANGGVSVPEGYAMVRRAFQEWIDTLDPTVWSRLSTYGAIAVEEYLQRLREIEPARVQAHARIEGLDLIAMPTTALTAPRLEQVEDLED